MPLSSASYSLSSSNDTFFPCKDIMDPHSSTEAGHFGGRTLWPMLGFGKYSPPAATDCSVNDKKLANRSCTDSDSESNYSYYSCDEKNTTRPKMLFYSSEKKYGDTSDNGSSVSRPRMHTAKPESENPQPNSVDYFGSRTPSSILRIEEYDPHDDDSSISESINSWRHRIEQDYPSTNAALKIQINELYNQIEALNNEIVSLKRQEKEKEDHIKRLQHQISAKNSLPKMHTPEPKYQTQQPKIEPQPQPQPVVKAYNMPLYNATYPLYNPFIPFKIGAPNFALSPWQPATYIPVAPMYNTPLNTVNYTGYTQSYHLPLFHWPYVFLV
ncbi:MAG: hypothetical protein PUP46_09495 [Endozoicomonas sp. (ex Botrylloides leachii)]|nr:hypothetical protein [Endozoicomonas sp. (ex Botrylloides leachii)]